MEELFCIRECCGGPVVAGCESMTIEQVYEWMTIHNEDVEQTEDCGDTQKYIYMPVGDVN